MALIDAARRRLRNGSTLRSRLAFAVVALVMVATGLVTLITLLLLRQDMVRTITEQQNTLLQRTVDELDQKFTRRLAVLEIIADKLQAERLGGSDAMQRYVSARPELKVWFDNILIFGANGDLLADFKKRAAPGSVNVRHRAYLQQTISTKHGLVSPPHRSVISKHAIVNLTAPIQDATGQVAAVLVGTIDLDRDNFFSEISQARIGGGGYFYALTTDGVFLSHPVAGNVLQSALPLLPQNPALARALTGFEGTLDSITGSRVATLNSFKRMRTTNWIVAVEMPTSEAFASIRYGMQRASLFALLVAVMSGALAWWITRRQLIPLDRLAQRFDAVRMNPALVAVPQSYAGDELGRLANSFDELMRERLFAETRYQSSAEELRAATNSILDAFYVLQAERNAQGDIVDFRFRYLNDNGARLLKIPAAELLDRRLCDFLPNTRTNGSFEKFVQVLKTGVALQEEQRLDSPQVDASWVSYQVTALADGIAVTARDISQRKRDEIELDDSRSFLKSLIDHLPVLVFSKTLNEDARGRFVLWNKAAERITGYTAEQVLGKTNHEIFSAPTADAYEAIDRMLIANGTEVDTPIHPLRRADGSRRILHSRTLPLRDATGTVSHGLGIAEDITEQRAQDRELIKKQAELNAVNDASPLALLRTDLNGHCTYVNRTFEVLSGLTPAQASGLGWLTAMPAEDAEQVLARWVGGATVRRDSEQNVTRLIRPDGKLAWVSIEVAPILIEGEPVGYVGSAEDVTERRAAHAALAFSEQRLRLIADNLPALVAYIDAAQRYQFCNAFYYESQQMVPAQMLGKSVRELFGVRWYRILEPYIVAALRGEHQSFERDTVTRQGRRFLQYEYIPDVRPDGIVAGFYSMVTDVTIRKSMEQDLLAEKERLRVTLNSIGDAVITTDMHGAVSYINPVAERMTGWMSAEALGRPLMQIFQTVQAGGTALAADPVSSVIASGVASTAPGSVLLLGRDGLPVAIENSAAPIRDADDQMIGVVMVFHDVSQAHVMAERMSHLAAHDALTGLLNRREFERLLELAVQSASSGERQHSVLYLDLDQFKVVNDTCGHVAGDELLRQLTTVLLDKLRQADILARLGGDEFGVLLENCAPAPALRIAEILRQTIGDFHFVWVDKVFPIGVSIGLVTFSNNGATTADVLRMADSACYVAKDKGRNRIHVYTEENAELVHRHGQMGWVARIRHALDADRFVLYCQPMRALDSERHGAHYELLIRMLDENDQLIPPMAFIPAAERYGLMPLLDRWVIRHALASHAPRHPPDAPAGLCAINLSGTSICDETFLPFVLEQFSIYGVPPSEICFEITETAAIANLSQAATLIRELKSIVCKFSLDDFGSGMSSFTYLKHLPIDFLKIDGSFVKDMMEDPIDRAMVESINHIGHVMGLITIAEFVESEAIITALREIGVDYAQGYAIARPLPC